MEDLATPKQVEFCKKLFRKVKLYYNCLDDARLVAEVKKRTGFDLDCLTTGEAEEIIKELTKVNGRRRGWRPPGAPRPVYEQDEKSKARLAEINQMAAQLREINQL